MQYFESPFFLIYKTLLPPSANIRTPTRIFKLSGNKTPGTRRIFKVYADKDDTSKYRSEYPIENHFEVDRTGVSESEAYLTLSKSIPGAGRTGVRMRRIISFELLELDDRDNVVQKHLSKIILFVSRYSFG